MKHLKIFESFVSYPVQPRNLKGKSNIKVEDLKIDDYVILAYSKTYFIKQIVEIKIGPSVVRDWITFKRIYKTFQDELKIDDRPNSRYSLKELEQFIIYKNSNLDDCIEHVNILLQSKKYNL